MLNCRGGSLLSFEILEVGLVGVKSMLKWVERGQLNSGYILPSTTDLWRGKSPSIPSTHGDGSVILSSGF